jgi:hypothetical protein
VIGPPRRRPRTVASALPRQVLAAGRSSSPISRSAALWPWGDQQTRHPAAEVGVTKGTLTGGLKNLEKRGPNACTPTSLRASTLARSVMDTS